MIKHLNILNSHSDSIIKEHKNPPKSLKIRIIKMQMVINPLKNKDPSQPHKIKKRKCTFYPI